MSDRGKRQLEKHEREEEEMKGLFLGIIEGCNDSVISPLSYFSPLQENNSRNGNGSNSRKGEMIAASTTKSFSERKRRDRMSENYSVLDSMVPNFFQSYKRAKENIVIDTVKYIKLLEEEVERLESVKKSQLEEPKMANLVLSKCTSPDSVKLTVTNHTTFLAVQRPIRRALVQDVIRVLEKHEAEVLEARFSVDEQRILTFTATIIIARDGASMIDKIKEEMLIL